MEMLSVCSLSVLTLSVLLLGYWLYKKVWLSFQVFKKMGVNGPKPEVFYGNSRQRERVGWIKFLRSVTEDYGPVSGFYQGTFPHLLISDLEMLKHILVNDFDCFMDRPWFPDVLRAKPNSARGLIQSNGAEWQTSRQTLSPTFSTGKMKMMVPLIENSANGLIRNIDSIVQSGTSANVHEMFGLFTLETIIATAFGRQLDIQGGENDELTRAVHFLFQGAKEGDKTILRYIYPITSHVPCAERIYRFVLHKMTKVGGVANTLQKTAHALIEGRRQHGQQGQYRDLLQLMIDANVEGDDGVGRLSNEEILVHSMTFLLAGYETTANTLTYTAYLLALHPEIQERLQTEIDSFMEKNPDAGLYEACQEITYLDMVVNETLRVYSTIPFLQRCCVETTTVNGLTIPAGVSVMVPVEVLHNDPQYWEEPDQFNPERFTAEEKAKRPQLCYMPFGYGRRNCIGQRFSLLEAKIALIQMLRKYSFERAPDTEVPLETVVGISTAPKNGVYLKVKLR